MHDNTGGRRLYERMGFLNYKETSFALFRFSGVARALLPSLCCAIAFHLDKFTIQISAVSTSTRPALRKISSKIPNMQGDVTMLRRLSRLLPCALLASAASGLAIAQDAPTLKSTTVMTGRDLVWDMAFLPNGTMFFTEKCRGLSVRLPTGTVNALLGMKDSKGYADTANDLFCSGQAGMAGVAVDPNFDQNRFIYVYSTSNQTTPHNNRVIRLTVSPDLAKVSNRTDIVTDIAYKQAPSGHPFGDAGAHNGGRLRFGPSDGFLYVTTGDTHNGPVPQSPTLIGGKVLRIDRDGKAAPGNNAAQGFDPRIFTYGHRNPQGICFRPGNNQPFTAENGPWHSDEVTALKAGGNAGWDPRPKRAGRDDCPDGYCGYMPNQMGAVDPKTRAAYMPMTDLKSYPDAMKPAWNNDGLVAGPVVVRISEQREMESMERQDGCRLHGNRNPRNTGGEPA